jgi:hypothetical protein
MELEYEIRLIRNGVLQQVLHHSCASDEEARERLATIRQLPGEHAEIWCGDRLVLG